MTLTRHVTVKTCQCRPDNAKGQGAGHDGLLCRCAAGHMAQAVHMLHMYLCVYAHEHTTHVYNCWGSGQPHDTCLDMHLHECLLA